MLNKYPAKSNCLAQLHGNSSVPSIMTAKAPPPQWVVPIDESNLQTVYLIFRYNKDSSGFSKHKIDIPSKSIDHVVVFYIEPMWVKGPLHCLVSRNGCFNGKRGSEEDGT